MNDLEVRSFKMLFFLYVMYLMKCWVTLSGCGIWVHDGGGLGKGSEGWG